MKIVRLIKEAVVLSIPSGRRLAVIGFPACPDRSVGRDWRVTI